MRNMPWVGVSSHSNRLLWIQKSSGDAIWELLGRVRYIRTAYH